MLAIPLISAECERVFSSPKHLITDSRNRLKADIIEGNECLKSWFGRPQAGAFEKGVDPNVDEQYKEEAAAKAAEEAAAKANMSGDTNTQEAGKPEDEEEDKEEGEENEEEDEEDKDNLGDNVIKYIIIDD